MRWPSWFGVVFALWMAQPLAADGPADNRVEGVRLVPPPGMEVSAERTEVLRKELADLQAEIAELASRPDPLVVEYLPDVEIFARAIALALRDQTFYEAADVDRGLDLLREGFQRAAALAEGETPWREPPQGNVPRAVVRGFRSALDGTAQPYGVVIQAGPVGEGVTAGRRADVWCRGRSERGLELQFLATRRKSLDPLPAPGVVMIHPFGRYCNANKLAGEIDTLEAIQHAQREYGIDPRRIAIRGFSMGGAAAWHLAVHYPDRWFAATPGAGFSETPEFLRVFQDETLEPAWFEQKLWQYYDCPVWVRNLRMLPTIAYSGALDKQKQAADAMARASWALPEGERFELTHLVAPDTGHQIAPAERAEIERRLDILDARRSPAPPRHVSFTTTTLRYPGAHWITIEALREHWVPSTIHGRLADDSIVLTVEPGVQQFSIHFDTDALPAHVDTLQVAIHEADTSAPVASQAIPAPNGPRPANSRVATPVVGGSMEWPDSLLVNRSSDHSWHARFRRVADHWERVSPLEPPAPGLRKRHQLQGPIDDAFLGPFLFVRPSGAGYHPTTDAWVEAELQHALQQWARQMRGEVRIKASADVTAEDLRRYHLVLWGDPRSNPTIAQVLGQLPLRWDENTVRVGDREFPGGAHVPLMIYPNPLAPEKYVVLNSSFTYREYDYLNNARQVPKLPDWAVIDITTAANARWPGRIADADFFDEQWQLKPLRPLLQP